MKYKSKVSSRMIVQLFLCFQLVNLGCASFPFPSVPTSAPKNETVKIKLVIDPLVKDSDGKDYFRLEDSLVEYANRAFLGCEAKCSEEVNVEIRFVADSNSRNSNLFKIWEWTGILTLGIIPVYEKTTFSLIAEVKNLSQVKHFEKVANRHLVSSIVLFPFYIFRDWREDSIGAQKNLIDQMYQEILLIYSHKE